MPFNHILKLIFFFVCLFSLVVCHSQKLVVLGTLQDGGSPHMNCDKDCCKEKKNNDFVVSLGLYDENQMYFFDCSPDFVFQHKYLKSISKKDNFSIFLTHAHMGHYSGLIHLGRESANTKGVPVYSMPKMSLFLENNGPWSQLVKLKNIIIKPIEDQQRLSFSKNLVVTPIQVPHRDEFSETVGYLIKGKEKSALYIPDIDKWSIWDKNIIDIIKEIDYAFIDATFFSGDEINRPTAEIPHPSILETVDLLSDLSLNDKNKIFFIHLNHTNPARNKNFIKRIQIENQGFNFAEFGMVFKL